MGQDHTEQEQHVQKLHYELHNRRQCMLMAGYDLSVLACTSDKQYPPGNWREVLKELADRCRQAGLITYTEFEEFHALLTQHAWSDAGAKIEAWIPNLLQRQSYLKEILLGSHKVMSEAHRLIVLPILNRRYVLKEYLEAFSMRLGSGICCLIP